MEDFMPDNISFTYSNSIEYLVNNNFIITYKNFIYLSKEDNFYCLDNFDEDETDESEELFYTFEELFDRLKNPIDFLKDISYEPVLNFNYSSVLVKKHINSLVELGFKIESKIYLSLEKKEDIYIVEYLDYDFLPKEKKGITTNNYKSLSVACEKFEKINNYFLESIKV